MLRRDKNKSKNPEDQHIDTLIGAHASFTGELSFEGALRIDGKFKGNIHSTQGGVLIVSEDAKITGEVSVPSLVLHGIIEGNVHASESLKVGPTGKLHGDLEYHIMSLSEGSSINGRCNKISDTPPKTESEPEAVRKAPLTHGKLEEI
ncbi:MAG: polymer-forming cytoskeletal protein [Mariprofundaceae bacterium]